MKKILSIVVMSIFCTSVYAAKIVKTEYTSTGTDYTVECNNGKWVAIGKNNDGVYTNGYGFSSYSFDEVINHACNR